MGVSRLDTNASVSAAFWNFEQDTIPNGTINLATRSSHVPNSGRVLILFYVGEHSTALTGSMTIGGVAPSIEYKNTYNLTVDLQTYVGIWLDADIEAMSGSTATTNGTWPGTLTEVWAYSMYMNVDQTNPLALGENYVEHGVVSSPSQYTVDTTSVVDKYILVLGGSNTAAGSLSSEDTLFSAVDSDDLAGNNMRLYVAEGPGGDNSTQIGPNGAGNHATYGLVLNYKRYALRMEARYYDVDKNFFGSVFESIRIPELEISSNQTTAGKEYLSCMYNLHLANTSAAAFVDSNFYQNGITAPSETETNNRECRRTGLATGHQHFSFRRSTMPGTGTYRNNRDFRGWVRSDGTNTLRVAQTALLLIDLTDLAEGDEFLWDDDATSYTTLDNTAWTEGATVTVPHAGNWLFFSYAHVIVDSSTAAIRVKLTINDTDHGNYLELAAEDVSEEYCHGSIIPIAGLAAGDVVKFEFQTNSATAGVLDIDSNRIFALKLDIFDDHFMEYDPTDTAITTVDTDEEVASFTHTTRLTQDTDYICGVTAIHDVLNSAARCSVRLDETTDGDIVGNIADSTCQNAVNDQVPLGPCWQMYAGQSNGSAKTFNVIVNEEEGGISLGTIVDTWAWGFTPNFAQSGPHEIFYGKRPNTLLRM